MIKRYVFPALLLSLMNLMATSWALDPIYTPWNNNLAIRGYDTVAYFTENKAVEGSAQFEYQWQGATWRFSSEQNQALFAGNPERYAPQYGGYCAYAVAEGKTASTDPEQFSIIDGKLYLNYNRKIQQRWQANTQEYIANADKFWPSLLQK